MLTSILIQFLQGRLMFFGPLWATFGLITFKKADKLNLIREEISISVVKVGGEKEIIPSYAYDLPLRDKSGKVIIFRDYGIDKISTYVKYISVKGEFRAQYKLGSNERAKNPKE